MHAFLRTIASLSRDKIMEEASKVRTEPDLRRLVTSANTYDAVTSLMFDMLQREGASGVPAGSRRQHGVPANVQVSALDVSPGVVY